jgi:predicted permease
MRPEHWIYTIPLRLRSLFRRREADQELDEELRYHVECKTEEYIARGMTPQEARRAALLEMGGIEKRKEECRDTRRVNWIQDLLQDAHYGLRMLRKSPGFTVVAILTLALGIGANTAIFSVVNGILFEPLPYVASSRLVTIDSEVRMGSSSYSYYGISLPVSRDILSECTAFEQVSTFQEGHAGRIRASLMPDFVATTGVSSDFFSMLGVPPLLGRLISTGDVRPGSVNVAVLSYKLWQDDFGADPNIVSRSILVDDKRYEIIGVMPREFEFGIQGKGLWMPLVVEPKLAANRAWGFYSIVARLKRGVTIDQARAQLQTLSARLSAEYPETDKGRSLVAKGVKAEMVSRVRTGLLILLGAVGFVLLVACVNTSALLVARSWTRQKEVAIRKALGATQLRLIRQFLSESALLAIASGSLGLLFSAGGVRVLRAIAPPYTPRIDHVTLDGNVLWFTLGISLLAAILFGLAPALQTSSYQTVTGPKEVLCGSFTGTTVRQRRSLHRALVCVEVALSVILGVGALLMVHSFERLIHVDTGLRTDHVLTMHVTWSDGICGYKTPEKCKIAAAEALDGIRSLSGVRVAAISRGFALLGGGYVMSNLYLEGRSEDQLIVRRETTGPFLDYHTVTSDYFDAVGIRLLAGRDFNTADIEGSPHVAVVNESFARAFISANPLGKRFAVAKDKSGGPEWIQIVGLVSDDRDFALREGPEPLYYAPAAQDGFYGVEDFIVRTSGDPLALAPVIEKQIWAVDKDAPIQDLKTLDQKVADSVAEPRFQTSILSSFGALGFLLAVVGIYGVISYAVIQRTHEIGVRMALGARPRDIARLFLGEGILLAATGIVIGVAGALGLTRFLKSLLFEVKPTDPLTFVGVAILLGVVALAACYIPARRAMKVDPMVALRHE